jgi:hypothetical protein
MSPVGLAGPAIDLEFAQLPSTDYTIPSAAAPLPPCVQSGSLALLPVEEGRGYAFTHWYDLLLLYREFALSSPVVAARRADPVTPAFEDVALALGPLGEYSLASPAAGGDFTKEHNERTVSFLEEVVLPSGTRPLVFYFNNWGLLDAPGPVPPPCPNRPPAPNPGAWAGLRPGVADLTRRVHEVGGLAMGYIHSYSFSPEWPEIDDDWALLDVAGNRARSDTEVWYCHATPESKRIWHELLVPGALEERPDGGMLDGLHVDGVNGADHCADGGQSPPDLHGHRLQTNELVEALDAYLEYARFRNVPGRRDRRFFDQEIPVEALLHRFDSSAQSQPLGQPAFPRLHRMVYGNLTRYSFVGYLFGQNPAANEYELFDMRGLAVLAEGGLPLYFYWDSPESPILNPAANPRTVGMLQAYLSNYRKVLAPVFAMDLLPAPRLDPRVERSPPECGFYYRGDLFTERDRFAREILPTDPLVHGAAFGDGRRAAVVLVNWATPIVGVPPPRVGTVRTVRVPPPCGVVTTSELSAITGDSMRSSLPVTVELDARVLRLDPSAPYPLRLFALNAGAPPQELPVVVEGEPDPELQGRALARFDLPSPSLAVLYVG